MDTIEKLRLEVDKINDELLFLINKRAEIVGKICKEKNKQGVSKFDPAREEKMMFDLIEKNKGPFSNQEIIEIFKLLFSELTWSPVIYLEASKTLAIK